MSRARIGGVLDMHAYAALADMHRPADDLVRAQALKLFHAGLAADQIAAALRLDVRQVQDWIAGATT